MMKEAFNSDPDVWWWVKGGGADVVKGVGESVRGIWSGDVDLNDGALDDLFLEYQKVLGETAQIGLGQRQHTAAISEDLTVAMGNLENYLTFISHSQLFSVMIGLTVLCILFILELLNSNTAFKEKLSVGTTTEKVMLELLWDIDTLKRLNEKGRALLTDLAALLDLAIRS
jgi:cell division protein ZapA (FtsZ GTPase activity inhibitor)